MKAIRFSLVAAGLSLLIPIVPASLSAEEAVSVVEAKVYSLRRLEVEVAESGPMFVPDTEPVIPGTENDEFPLPAYGSEFLTSGYLYPPGTLTCGEEAGGLVCDGVNEDGTPEFPDLVIGTWTCRGWHVGNGAITESGAWVATSQIFSFTPEITNEYGASTITTDGFESPEAKEVRRAVTGGTGPFMSVAGEQIQSFRGWNPSVGVGLSVEFRFKKRWR